jgi:hypothetical protein
MYGPNGLFGVSWSPPSQAKQPTQEELFKNKVNDTAPPAPQYIQPLPQQFGNSKLGPLGRAQAEKALEAARKGQIKTRQETRPGQEAGVQFDLGEKPAIGPGMINRGYRTYIAKQEEVPDVQASTGPSPKQLEYAQWQKDANRWATSFDGHGRSPPGPPPKQEKTADEDRMGSREVLRKQWDSATQWNTGAGLAVDFTTPTAAYGLRKDKGTPGSYTGSHANLGGKKKEILANDKFYSSDGLEGMPRKWKGTLELGVTTRPESATAEAGGRRGGSDWLRCAAPNNQRKKFGGVERAVDKLERRNGRLADVDTYKVQKAMHPIDVQRTGVNGENRLCFKPRVRTK